MRGDVAGDAAPQELDHPVGAVVLVDAAASDLDHAAQTREIGNERHDVVLAGRVETAVLERDLVPEQAIGADHRLGARPAVVDHQQMVAISVELVEVAAAPGGGRIGLGAEFLVEDAVAERLRRGDVGAVAGDADLEPAFGREQRIGQLEPASGHPKLEQQPRFLQPVRPVPAELAPRPAGQQSAALQPSTQCRHATTVASDTLRAPHPERRRSYRRAAV